MTENVADAMNLEDRGKLEVERKFDFLALDRRRSVKQSWVMGQWSILRR